MSQNSSPDNVPSANQGIAESVAAPGCVGAGGAIPFVSELFEFKEWLHWYIEQSEDFLDEAREEWANDALDAEGRVSALYMDIVRAKAALDFARMYEEQGE